MRSQKVIREKNTKKITRGHSPPHVSKKVNQECIDKPFPRPEDRGRFSKDGGFLASETYLGLVPTSSAALSRD